jgi:hypothetical protein
MQSRKVRSGDHRNRFWFAQAAIHFGNSFAKRHASLSTKLN